MHFKLQERRFYCGRSDTPLLVWAICIGPILRSPPGDRAALQSWRLMSHCEQASSSIEPFLKKVFKRFATEIDGRLREQSRFFLASLYSSFSFPKNRSKTTLLKSHLKHSPRTWVCHSG